MGNTAAENPGTLWELLGAIGNVLGLSWSDEKMSKPVCRGQRTICKGTTGESDRRRLWSDVGGLREVLFSSAFDRVHTQSIWKTRLLCHILYVRTKAECQVRKAKDRSLGEM